MRNIVRSRETGRGRLFTPSVELFFDAAAEFMIMCSVEIYSARLEQISLFWRLAMQSVQVRLAR
jgi:hypothetical protein